MENFSQMLEGSLKTLHTGETVTGTVFTIGQNEIKLDLGAKFTGVLTKEQITDDPDAKLSEMFKVGDEVEVFVIRVEDGKGLASEGEVLPAVEFSTLEDVFIRRGK